MYKSFIVKDICREDLREYLSEKEISRMDDDKMSVLASKLGDALAEPYWISLEVLLTENKDYFLED